MFHAVVVEDALDFGEGSALEGVDQVGMPEADALEADPGAGFDAVLEVEQTVFVVRVRFGAARQRPIRSNQLNIVLHGVFPSSFAGQAGACLSSTVRRCITDVPTFTIDWGDKGPSHSTAGVFGNGQDMRESKRTRN